MFVFYKNSKENFLKRNDFFLIYFKEITFFISSVPTLFLEYSLPLP